MDDTIKARLGDRKTNRQRQFEALALPGTLADTQEGPTGRSTDSGCPTPSRSGEPRISDRCWLHTVCLNRQIFPLLLPTLGVMVGMG